MAHTKGPYRIATYDHDDGSKTVCIKQDRGSGDLNGFILAEMCSETGNDEGNALLFAASSDLLEALEEMMESFEYNVDHAAHHPAYKKAQAAIAKAKGDSQ